jgi:hypothetical protein
MSCVLVYYDILGSRPPCPYFYMPRSQGLQGRSKSVITYPTRTLSLLAYFTRFNYLISLKCLGLWASWPGSLGQVGRLMAGPFVLISKSGQSGTHGTKPHQQLLSAWQVNIHCRNSSLPCFGEVVECSVLFNIISQMFSNVGRVSLSQF